MSVAVVGLVIAHDAFDERALAGAVLAEQRMERAGRTFIDTSSSAANSPKRLVMAIASTPKVFLPRSAWEARRRDEVAIRSRDDLDEFCRIANRAEHAALHLDHLERVVVIAFVGRAAAILQQQAFEAAVVGLAHGGVHADVGGDAGQHDVVDAAQAQHQLKIGGAERALARLVDDRLARRAAQARG